MFMHLLILSVPTSFDAQWEPFFAQHACTQNLLSSRNWFAAEVLALLSLSYHHFFLLMLLHVCRKKGAILNISSGSGMYPVPLLTVYSASKVIALHMAYDLSSNVNWSVFYRRCVNGSLYTMPLCLNVLGCLIQGAQPKYLILKPAVCTNFGV